MEESHYRITQEIGILLPFDSFKAKCLFVIFFGTMLHKYLRLVIHIIEITDQ
jgi:hypothetical protein